MYIRYNGESAFLDGQSYYTYSIEYIDSTTNKTIINSNLRIEKKPCFGALTKQLPGDTKITGYVGIYYNEYTSVEQFWDDSQFLRGNIGTFLQPVQFNNMFVTLSQALQKYVPHRSSNLNTVAFMFVNNTAYQFNKKLVIQFTHCTYTDILLLLNMYRRLITIDCIRGTLAAFKLHEQRWKRCSLVNLLLLSDLIQYYTLPYDSLLGLMYVDTPNVINWFTAEKYNALKSHVHREGIGRYMWSYSDILTGNTDMSKCNFRERDLTYLRTRYHLPVPVNYNDANELQITSTNDQDVEKIKTWYRFIQLLIRQNIKNLNK